MRIIVDEMPSDPRECPYVEDESYVVTERYICTYRKQRKCSNTADCPYFRAIADTQLAERVSEMEWRHRNYSEEE